MIPGRFPPGTDVLAPWGDDPCLYPAVVLGVDPATQQAFVVYWDGGTAGVHDAKLAPLQLAPGMRVEADYMRRDDYVPCIVLRRAGAALCLQNPAGNEVWCAFSKIRVRT